MHTNKMLYKRVISGIVLVAFFIFIVWLSGKYSSWQNLPVFALVCLIVILCSFELHKLLLSKPLRGGKTKEQHKAPATPKVQSSLSLILSTAISFPLFYYWLKFQDGYYETLVLLLLTLSIVFCLMTLVSDLSVFFSRQHLRLLKPALMVSALNLLGGAYIGGLLGTIILICYLPKGLSWFVVLLFSVWASDTVAYFVGMWFGSYKLFKKLSPQKTLEGFVAGFMAAVIVAGIVAKILWLPLITGILGGIVIGIFAPLGDLLESAVKRCAKVKDAGELIPGHGGALDRFDSLILAAPALYLLLIIILL